MERIAGIIHVLDGFHLEQYLTRLTSHMKDSRMDAMEELRTAIRSKTKGEFTLLTERLEGYLEDERGFKRMKEARDYILSNWTPSRLRLSKQDGVKGSSTEGHVSHVLSSRMSSRPMGWSVAGASKMAQLCAYYLNDGDMLKLVRYQKKDLSKAVGSEYEILKRSNRPQSG